MLKFLLLVLVAVGVRGDGYKYPNPSNSQSNVFVSTSGHAPIFPPSDFVKNGANSQVNREQTYHQSSAGHAFQSNEDYSTQHNSGSFQSTQQNGNFQGGIQQQTIQTTDFSAVRRGPPIVKKFFYAFGAPAESTEEISSHTKSASYQPEEHYKIIFIKVPGQVGGISGSSSSINLGNRVEEKTKVYVLLKEQGSYDSQDDVNINLPASEPAKPEVVFIKYKSEKKINNVDGVSGIKVIGNGNISEDELNEEIAKAGGIQNIGDESFSSGTIGAKDAESHSVYGVPN